VLEAVGITYDRFLCTSYLTQQAGGLSFIRGTNSQQMSGIFESLGLRDWDKVMEGFKTNRDYASLRVTQLESSLAQVDSALAVLVLPTDQEIVAEGQKEAERAKHIEVAQGHLTVAEKMLSDMKVQLALLEQNVNPYTQPLANANGQLAWLKQTGPNRQSTDLISIDQQIYSANSQIKACESSAKAKNCPTCKQSLPTASTQNVEQEIQKHRKQLSYLEANRANIVKTMSDAFSKELAEAEAKVALLIQNSNIFEASGVVEQKAAAKKSIVQYESQVSHWKVELQRLHGEQAQYTAWVNKNAQITEKRSKLIEQRQVIEAEYAVVKKDHDEWAWLWKNSGDKGFKSWKLASSIDRLNAILAEVLGEIDPSLKVWCQSFRYKAKAPKQVVKQDDLIHEFTIFVRDGTKSVVPLELYSGGESSVIAIALMVAQWRLSSEQGGGTNLLALDEIASALDQRSSQLVANFIESLKTVGKTVIMISHNNLIDIMDFDHKWRVTKKNDISSIEVDPCEE
jgi:DNA repair exonuclease SbcCD ATPase subunit